MADVCGHLDEVTFEVVCSPRVRPGPWLLLLALLLSTLALAREAGGPVTRQRILFVPVQTEESPALTLHLAAGLATLVDFDAPFQSESLELSGAPGRVQLVPVDTDTLVLVAPMDLTEGERFQLTVSLEPHTGPLHFVLMASPEELDTSVKVVRGQPPTADEDAARAMALHLLAEADARATLAIPQQVMEFPVGTSRAQIESILRLGPRIFVTLSVRSRQRNSRPWSPKQLRLRATLGSGGSVMEWSVLFLSGAPKEKRQSHVLTALLPEGTTRLELALDTERSAGAFRVLALDEVTPQP